MRRHYFRIEKKMEGIRLGLTDTDFTETRAIESADLALALTHI
jgi:hypothetical protein